MEIAKLGEFGLIDRLTKDIEIKNDSTKYGVGDDCAVLSYPDKEVLVTTDLLMEGVHFDLTYIDLKHLGYKSAMVNISDVFAMNGTPRQITVSLAVSKRFTVEDMEEFYAGLRLACDKWGVDIVGGDTTASYTGLAISITCIGEAATVPKHQHSTTSLPLLYSSPTSAARNTCYSANSRPKPVATLSKNSVRPASILRQ